MVMRLRKRFVVQEERREMQLQLEAVTAQWEDAQAAASAAQADKQLLQRQLAVSTDSNERLQAALETQYAPT